MPAFRYAGRDADDCERAERGSRVHVHTASEPVQGLDTNTELCSRLSDALGSRASVSATYLFGDLLWDEDMTAGECERIGGSVRVDAPKSSRAIFLMLVRGEIRYWLTTDRDPYAACSTSGMGVAPSFDAALVLCDEFIDRGLAVDSLTTPPKHVVTL